VTETNEALATAPEQVNKDAHASWMVKVKVKNPAELNALLSAADYEKVCERRGGTLGAIAEDRGVIAEVKSLLFSIDASRPDGSHSAISILTSDLRQQSFLRLCQHLIGFRHFL
jgi:hypothetical protein